MCLKAYPHPQQKKKKKNTLFLLLLLFLPFLICEKQYLFFNFVVKKTMRQTSTYLAIDIVGTLQSDNCFENGAFGGEKNGNKEGEAPKS